MDCKCLMPLEQYHLVEALEETIDSHEKTMKRLTKKVESEWVTVDVKTKEVAEIIESYYVESIITLSKLRSEIIGIPLCEGTSKLKAEMVEPMDETYKPAKKEPAKKKESPKSKPKPKTKTKE